MQFGTLSTTSSLKPKTHLLRREFVWEWFHFSCFDVFAGKLSLEDSQYITSFY